MFVCLCNAVTDSVILAAIERGARDEATIERVTAAGGMCGGCLPAIRDLIARERAAADEDRSMERSVR